MSYYIFNNLHDAQTALAALEAEMREIARERGFTVLPDGGVVGRNPTTGKDNPASITTSWDEIKETADGRWAFTSCRGEFPTTYARVEIAANLPEPQDASILNLEAIEE